MWKTVEQLVIDNNYDELVKIYEAENKVNWEVHFYDDQNDLCTLQVLENGDVEWIRRSTVKENDVFQKTVQKPL